MKIALVHDYLNEAGGAERVLRVLCEMYPSAPIYTAFIKNGTARAMFEDRELYESSWGWILKIGRLYSYLRFLLPWIWRSIDLSSYDLVITSTSGGYIARGFGVGPKTRVVAYCHTPPKWLYGYETPTGAGRKWWGKLFMAIAGPFLRYFDYQSAQRVNVWIANSEEVAGRIAKFYRREARVVYPPIQFSNLKFSNSQIRGDYYLLVARITGAKGVREAIAAAERGKFRLILVGEKISNKDLGIVNNEWVEYLGRVSDAKLVELYSRARGFIALARDEDFGMTVVEAMQCGTPVLALKSGGYRETVVDPGKQKNRKGGESEILKTRTGVFIENTDLESVLAGIRKMETIKWDHKKIAAWGNSFSRARFEKEIRGVINARVA